MSNEMTVQSGSGGMIPAYQDIGATITACEKVGEALQVAMQLASPHHGTIMMLTCMSEGITVSDYRRRYHNDGSMRAAAIQAEFLARGGKIEWVSLGDEGTEACAMFSHSRLMPTPVQIKYTIEDAKRQVGEKFNKPGNNWVTNPGAMLRAALVRKAVKIIDPGVITGHDDFEEFAEGSPATQQADIEDRKAQLLSGMNEPEVIVTATQDAPEPVAEPEAKPEKVTMEQLTRLCEMGEQFPSKVDPTRTMTRAEIAEGLCIAAEVQAVTDIAYDDAEKLIAQFEEQLQTAGK